MKKIAILISGNNDNKINKKKILAGYDFENNMRILRYQFEKYYEVDYYIVMNKQIDLNIFDNKVKKFKILPDTQIKAQNEYGFSKRHLLKKIIKDTEKENYEFYLYVRNDRILVPNGFGLWTRTVKYEESAGWKRVHMMEKEDYYRHFKFKDSINLDYIYCISYGYKTHISQADLIWDGLCLGNYENINIFLNFDCNKFDYNNTKKKLTKKLTKKLEILNKFANYPEYRMKQYLDKNNLQIESIDKINDIPDIDEHLQMISNPGYA